MIYEKIITERTKYDQHPFKIADANAREYVAESAYFTLITDEYDMFHNCDHEDLLQDCYLYTYEHWDTLRNYTIPIAIGQIASNFVHKATTKSTLKQKDLVVCSGIRVETYYDFEALEETVLNCDLRETLIRALSTLTPREEYILKLRFGIEDGEELTQKEIGSIFKITGGRVGQVEAKALRKMRHPSRSRDLKVYLGGLW